MIRWLSFLLLKRSIRKYGVVAPVLVSRSGVVLDGNRRVQACLDLGIPVPVVCIDADIKLIDASKLTISCPINITKAIQ